MVRVGKMLLTIVEVAAAAVLGLALYLYLSQERILFHPNPAPAHMPEPAQGSLEKLALLASDGSRQIAWLVRRTGRSPLVIYFGGNAEDVSWLIEMNDRFAGYSLLLVNYRGYGPSEGRPGESALFADALAWHDLVADRADVEPGRIVAMGRSLGSGVAVHLAANRKLAGVILVSPYDSVRSLAKSTYPYLPIDLMLRHPFDSVALAGAVATPLLCLVAEGNNVIPPTHSRRLFETWGTAAKSWRLLSADHDSISARPEYWREIEAFLDQLRVLPPEGPGQSG